MRRSEAPTFIELCAETGAGLAVVTILSDMVIGFRIPFDLRGGVSPTSLTNSCVFPDFLAINVNGAYVLAPTTASAGGAASADTARLRRRDWRALVGN